MAHIKKITFHTAGRQEGCVCDRCGQYIRNIWTVQYADGVTMRFGIDCFEILTKESGLSAYGRKQLNKALKSIEKHRELYEREKNLTEETDIAWQNIQHPWDYEARDYWYDRPWEEYHEWRMNEFFKIRFEEDQREIDRFSGVNFAR